MFVKLFIFIGGLAGCSRVVLGALSAHALKQRLDPASLTSLQTSSSCLLVHGLLLIVIAALLQSANGSLTLRIAGFLAVAGIVLFCGGLSASVLSGIHGRLANAWHLCAHGGVTDSDEHR